MLPSLVLIAAGADASRSLLLSQVVLSFGIPFAVIPLVIFCGDRGLMGTLVNARHQRRGMDRGGGDRLSEPLPPRADLRVTISSGYGAGEVPPAAIAEVVA